MTTRSQALQQSVQAAFGDRAVAVADALGEVTLVIKAADVREVMLKLRDAPEFAFDELIDDGEEGADTWAPGTRSIGEWSAAVDAIAARAEAASATIARSDAAGARVYPTATCTPPAATIAAA